MQARYLLVRGVPGHLVANPHAPPMTRRMLGKMPNGVYWGDGPIDPETNAPRWPAAVPVEEVVLDEVSIRKACNRGGLVFVGECVASSLEEARSKLLKKAPSAEVK
jgi:hypothetical protein